MNNVERYIAQFEPEVKDRLTVLRQLFFEVVPDTEESIRYNMPAFTVGKHHLYFAAYKKHIGFYPVYDLPEIEEQIAPFRAKGTKDSLHFPHNKPLPVELIKEIIRAKERKG
jgi:uncharacterized protein YdhG (YjbR/CyaY superfamily)